MGVIEVAETVSIEWLKLSEGYPAGRLSEL